MWEQLSFAPATGIAGSNFVDDDERYIYYYIQTSATAAQFWRYCTWFDCWQQLATPPTQTGTVANMMYTKVVGGQFSGQVFGSIYLFVGNATICYFYKYNVATNTWAANLGTTGIPATFATDCYLMYPSVPRNNYETAYHSGVTRTITTSALAAAGATTVSVTALPEALVSGTILRFGKYDITITAAAARGTTSLTVTGATEAMKAGTILQCYNGCELCLSADSAASATTLTIYPLQKGIPANSIIEVDKYAVLTAAAAASATSLTVAPLRVGIPSAATAGYYGNMYLVGNNATVVYRYNIGANAWATTSANSGNPAIAAAPGGVGLGGALKWLPAYSPDKLWCLRGGATSSVYIYDLVANTWATETYYPSTETFTTGTTVAARGFNGKQGSLFIQKDNTMRIYEGVPYRNTLVPKLYQWLYPNSTAVVGDKSCILTSPDGIDFYYIILHSSPAFVRCALIDS
jgi:hypothetical protein